MNDLKRCPFCGGKARMRSFLTYDNEHHRMGEKYYIECQNCFINGPGNHWTQEAAADAWNTRTGYEKETAEWEDASAPFYGISDDGTSVSFPTKKCSNCKKPVAIVMWDNFCPNCGAAMKEVSA